MKHSIVFRSGYFSIANIFVLVFFLLVAFGIYERCKNRSMQKEIMSLEENLSAVESKKKSLSEELQQTKDALKKSETDIQALTSSIAESRDKIKQLEEQSAAKDTAHTNEVSRITDELKKQKEDELSAVNEKAAQENRILSAEIDQLQKEIDTYRTTAVAFQEKLKDAESGLEECRKREQKLLEQSEADRLRAATLEKDLNAEKAKTEYLHQFEEGLSLARQTVNEIASCLPEWFSNKVETEIGKKIETLNKKLDIVIKEKK